MEFKHYFIRPLELTDIDGYFIMVERNRKRLEDFFTGTVSRTRSLEDTQLFLKEMIQKRNDKLYYPYVIVNTKSAEIIGFLDLKNIDWNIPKAEIGCYIEEVYAGKGITSEAFDIFVVYCFDHFNFKKLFLRTHATNLAAKRLAIKSGFELEGTLRRDYKTTAGILVDLLYYGKLN